MRVLRFMIRVLFAILRGLLSAALAIVKAVTVCLLWLLAPKVCVAVWVLRRR